MKTDTTTESTQPSGNMSALSVLTIYTYRLINVTNGSDYVGPTVIAVAIGEPGVTLSIQKTRSVSNTYSLSAGLSSVVNSSTVSAGVGYSVTNTESISITGSAVVPSQNEGRSVRTMTLNAYPVYATKNFVVQRHTSVRGINLGWANYGTGYSRRAYGVYYSKTFSYR